MSLAELGTLRTSHWIGSTRREKFLLEYKQAPKNHLVYLLSVPCDNVLKIGRSSRFSFRIRNLRAGIYKPHDIHILKCSSAEESLNLDRFLKQTFRPRLVVGEWISGTRADVEKAIQANPEFNHLSFSDAEDADSPILYKADHRPKSIEYNIVLS